jgi:hypothetical protein
MVSPTEKSPSLLRRLYRCVGRAAVIAATASSVLLVPATTQAQDDAPTTVLDTEINAILHKACDQIWAYWRPPSAPGAQAWR